MTMDLIQIKAENEAEVLRRIDAFIRNKRQEIDEQNIREFINPFSADPDGGCARTEAVYLHRAGEKSHISLKRVENSYGPQTRLTGDDANELNKASTRLPIERERAEAVEERLANMEAHLNMKDGGRGIFERLKCLEKRISFLESVSPEYFTNGAPTVEQRDTSKNDATTCENQPKLQTEESLADVNSKIMALKQALKSKIDNKRIFPS